MRIGLVDPIRTSTTLIDELVLRDLEPIVIESGACGRMQGDNVVRAGSLDEMAAALRRRRVDRVLGCVDPSLLYADELNALLGLPFNGLRRSLARRDKYAMGEAVRAAGLSAPWQMQSTDLGELRRMLTEATYPVVVKPPASGGTDNVYLCRTSAEAIDAATRILHAKNLMGGVNEAVLVQQYVDGIEYVVDCVSYDGVHVPVDVFRYYKGDHNGRAFIYEKERFLRHDDPASRRLVPFACGVLDALEIRTGASHMEIKIDSRGEIHFLEMGARLNGGDIAQLVRDVRLDGRSQVEYWIDSVLGERAPEAAYGTARDGVRVHIVSHGEGVLAEWLHLERIRSLSSFRRMTLLAEPGTRIGPTTNLSDDAGWIDLAHERPEVLQADEEVLDALLARGVMRLAQVGARGG